MGNLFEAIAGLFKRKTPAPVVVAAPPLPSPVAPPAPTLKALPVDNPAKLSTHFSWAEVSASNTARGLGIDNSVPDELKDNVRAQAKLMESARDILGGHAVLVTSWYRCRSLNAAVGGVEKSAHRLGFACDFVCPTVGDALAVAKAVEQGLRERGVEFDQLIAEGTWVHLAAGPGKRRQVMTMHAGGYKNGLLTVAQFREA